MVIELRIFGKVIVAAALTHAVVILFKLGWFLPIVWAAGALGIVFATRHEWAQTNKRIAFAALAAVSYLMVTIGSFRLMTDHKRNQTFNMVWVNNGSSNGWKEAEVVLSYVDHPGFIEGIYSNELAKYLMDRGDPRVEVTVEITSDFGCMRGYRQTKIGELEQWRSQSSYGGARGNARDLRSPWGERGWWCRWAS